jgi:hypothetical protein
MIKWYFIVFAIAVMKTYCMPVSLSPDVYENFFSMIVGSFCIVGNFYYYYKSNSLDKKRNIYEVNEDCVKSIPIVLATFVAFYAVTYVAIRLFFYFVFVDCLNVIC